MLLFFMALIGILSSRPNAAAVQDGALLLNLDGIIVEEKSQVDPLELLTRGSAPTKEYLRRDIVRALEASVEDDQVKAVVLDLDKFAGAGQATLTNIGDALDKVRETDKPVYAYATIYGDDAFQLAAHADEVWVNPLGGVAIAGPGGSRLYYADLIDKLNITTHIYKVGTYKSAIEPYSRSDQSPEAKEALSAVLESLWEQYLDDVGAARPDAKVGEIAADPATYATEAKGDLAQAALGSKLVDKIGDRVAFGAHVAETVGVDDENAPGSYKHTKLPVWLAANAPDTSGEQIGVITIAGAIVDGKAGPGVAAGDRIEEQLYKGLENEDLKALVVRVDSGGGSMFASEQMRKAIMLYKERGLPVIVSMGNFAASGGYWVATPGDQIFAEPSTITGSIGIFAVLPSFEQALADIGVNADGVTTTPLSGQPDFVGGFNESIDAVLQSSIENGYDRFLTIVADSRGKSKEQIDAIGQGRIWDGGTARQNGLVDKFGGLDDALAEAAKQAGIEGDYHAVYLEPEPDQFAQFLSGLMNNDEAQQGAANSMVGYVAARQQMQLGRLATDFERLLMASDVQAECLECAALSTPSSASSRRGADWLKILGTFAASR
ncbi:signal peptide peptidase SppA [Alterisphingorhabdus coralli]|uniref:Signal peptide peptidase SppA n=1 Tax=Alterisphingorhabdus coralli TaxID=3071408 RepID=A0AA97F8D6_9SPHN|nr:signal peptide peptidase SppA [Parasphingorhabdus sp. SCSIO 66989]WOE76239.1 signal peptide peptidase SppA [Parasphingorhabdus sp. SCSIO 66989]